MGAPLDQAIEYVDPIDAILNPVLSPTAVQYINFVEAQNSPTINPTAVEFTQKHYGAAEYGRLIYTAKEHY
jgi:hypothetical protein